MELVVQEKTPEYVEIDVIGNTTKCTVTVYAVSGSYVVVESRGAYFNNARFVLSDRGKSNE